MCSRFVALFKSQNLLLLPQTGKPKEPSAWGWCCVLVYGHSGFSLELGCFQPALLCQVLLIQEHVVGVFPLGRRSIAAFSLLCLLASLGVGSLCSHICRGTPNPVWEGKGGISNFCDFSVVPELKND